MKLTILNSNENAAGRLHYVATKFSFVKRLFAVSSLWPWWSLHEQCWN